MSLFIKKLCVLVVCVFALFFSSTAIAKKKTVDSASPIVSYNFNVFGELAGGEELWVNEVYLGKMPFTITREEFMEKVPFMEEPPEGYADENKHKLNGYWFKIEVVDLKKRDNKRSVYYETLSKFFYARVKLNDEWGTEANCSPGGGGGNIRQDYDMPIFIKFPSRQKLIAEKEQRLKTLLRIAVINDYKLSADWYKAIDTYGEGTWRDFWYGEEHNGDLGKILDGWACWKFKIDNPNDLESAKKGFKEICKYVNSRKKYGLRQIEARALEVIYDKLDLDELISAFKQDVKSGKRFSFGGATARIFGGLDPVVWTTHNENTIPASSSVIFHALQLWDKKFDSEDYESANRIELEIVPLIIQKTARKSPFSFEQAVKIGGPVMMKFLLRNDWRTTEPGIDNIAFNTDFGNLNRWLYYLINIDDPEARKFRQENSQLVMEIVDNCRNRSMNGEPPHFLTIDAQLGKDSLAWQYKDRYAENTMESDPVFESLNRQFRYLSMFGTVVTVDDYLDTWHKTHKKKSPHSLYMSVDQAYRAIQPNMAREFGERLIDYYEKKQKTLGSRNKENRREFDDYSSAVSRIRRNLREYGGEHALLNDSDDDVKGAAKKTSAEIEKLSKIPLETLVAFPKTEKENK